MQSQKHSRSRRSLRVSPGRISLSIYNVSASRRTLTTKTSSCSLTTTLSVNKTNDCNTHSDYDTQSDSGLSDDDDLCKKKRFKRRQYHHPTLTYNLSTDISMSKCFRNSQERLNTIQVLRLECVQALKIQEAQQKHMMRVSALCDRLASESFDEDDSTPYTRSSQTMSSGHCCEKDKNSTQVSHVKEKRTVERISVKKSRSNRRYDKNQTSNKSTSASATTGVESGVALLHGGDLMDPVKLYEESKRIPRRRLNTRSEIGTIGDGEVLRERHRFENDPTTMPGFGKILDNVCIMCCHYCCRLTQYLKERYASLADLAR